RAFLIVLAGLVMAPVWSPRPQVTSLVCLAGTAYLLYLYREKGVDRLWLLPLLFCLWSNLHGGYALGFLWLGFSLAGEVANHLVGLRIEPLLEWKQILRIGLWSGLSLVAVLINPNGLATWLIPFQTVDVRALQQFISEWASPDFHAIEQQPMLWMVCLLVMAMGLSRQRVSPARLFPVVGFAYLAFLARRNFGPFALVTAPELSRQLWHVLSNAGEEINIWLAGRGQGLPAQLVQDLNRPPLRGYRWVHRSIYTLLVLAAMGKVLAVTQPVMIQGALDRFYPLGAVQWLQNHPQTGRMLSEYNWGGYLIWRLPEEPVFVDGRTDLFGDEIIGQWMTLVQAGDGWQELLSTWNIRTVLVSPGRQIGPALEANGWRLLYSDGQSRLYAAPGEP
ncbi:MAG: hypothetical protein GYA17_04925, partial [Chloroflexi bacterium]|nr:hypothetical protein [Chloroflexota bacterium]